jgi:putative inorganic carbon (HCO3(-)) transporter
MRDILVTLLILGSIPYILKRPYLGVIVWSWLAYMNPHRLTWGFAYSMPFSMLIAAVTVMAFMFGKDNKKLPMTGITSLLIAFLLWQTISTLMSSHVESAMVEMVRVYKIQFVVFLTLIMFQNKDRIIQLVTIIALSIGFFGIKGGVFAIATGLSYTVWGPPDTFIEGNNELGLALLMVIPLFYFLHGHYQNKWVKLGILFSIVLMLASVASTYSRGAFLASICMMLFLWLKTKNKIVTGALGLVLITGLFIALPSQWFDRINTIENYEVDASAQGRIIAWKLAANVANDNVTGGGFSNTFTVYNYLKYYDEMRGTDAHSIYFEVLGEQGYIGLFIFLSMFYLGWRNGNWIIKKTKNVEGLEWASRLSAMLQVSLVAYGAGGAFLGLAYYDLPYHILALIVVTRIVVERDLKAKSEKDLQPEVPSNDRPPMAQLQER